MAGLRLSQYSSQTTPLTNTQQLKRFAYISIVPVLAVLLLLVMFGMMGALPSWAKAAGNGPWYATVGGSGTTCSTVAPCSLTTAVFLASDGEEVRVAQGSYTASGVAPVISVTKSITLTGGYSASGWDIEPNPFAFKTILDGQNNRRVISITADASPHISNFHIENGKVTGQYGAGIYISKGIGQPLIHHNVISNNLSTTSGGGIFDGAGSIIEYNDIQNNTANTSDGGGIVVENNGTGMTSIIRFNNIYENTATGAGGGILIRQDGSDTTHAQIIANYISNNNAGFGGGTAIFADTDVLMMSNMIYDNQGGNAGGLYASGEEVALWNNTFFANTASGDGDGLYLEGAVQATISNNIIASNGDNGIHDAVSPSGDIAGTNNLIYDNSSDVSLPNTLTDDPLFVNEVTRNLHLKKTSPAVEAGYTNTPSFVDVDIDEQLRPNESAYDIGADEYYADFAKFTLSPIYDTNLVERGNVETFAHIIENTGTVSDTYTISCSSDIFTMTACASPVHILAGGSPVQITTDVRIPSGIAPYTIGKTWITATSSIDPSLSETAQVASQIAPHPGISFTPNYSRTELPGEIITLTHYITNTGDAYENFIVTKIADTNDWAQVLPSDPYTIGMSAGSVRTIQVQIEIPEFASKGLENIIQVQASSEFDPSIFETVVHTITAKSTVGTRYVSFTGDNVDNNCTQPDKPCGTIGHAVGQSASGDEIRIGPGEFKEHDIALNDAYHISGGWKSFGSDGQGDEPDPSLTIINAENSGSVFVINAQQPTISVLTMKNGRSANGGAVLVKNPAQPDFENVVFVGNHATTRGGALFMDNGTAVSILKSSFISNTAQSGGGAVYMNGGSLSFRQTEFLTNTTNSNNGGAFVMTNGSFIGQNNLFHNNEATTGDGGAVSLSDGTATFNFTTWVANNASTNGGGVYNNNGTLSVQNSVFYENNATNGSAIFESGSSTGSTDLDYLDLWGNVSNVVTGTHSITADPLFKDEQFRLGLGSPAIDTADPSSTLDIDFEDDFRPSDEGFDMGYDERAGCRAKREDTIYGSIQAAVDVESPDDLVRVSGICRGVHTIEYGGESIEQTVHLTKSLIIQGGWNGDFSKQYHEPTQVDPEGRGRGFFISNGVSVTIEAISIMNGSAIGLGGGPADEDAGGGFYNVDGQVTLRGVSVLTSTADIGAGFYNDAGNPLLTWLRIASDPQNDNKESYVLTEFSGGTAVSGAGVYNNTGELVVDGSWIHHNQADNGGGLFNLSGPITVANTILDSNLAIDGAGLYNQAPTASYLHMTVYSNTATGNGGGFYNADGQPIIHSTIFESNRAGSGSAIYDDAAGTNSDPDYNYYYENDGDIVIGTVTGTHSIVSVLPPGLADPLYGDFHLLDNGLASDVADPDSPITTDFEDDPRPSNQGFDIGADEMVGCLVQLGDKIYGSLQTAIDAAEPDDVIKISGTCSGVHVLPPGQGVGNACVDGTLTAVHITKTITLQGGWDDTFSTQKDRSTIDANSLGRVIYIGQNASPTLESLELINGAAPNGAGICIDNAMPIVQNNYIYSNTATSDGGGIYSLNSQPRLEGGNNIFKNKADAGGGLYITGTELITATIQNNFIFSNTATTGAGIDNESGDHVYWHNTIYGNSASSTGGGFEIQAGEPQIRGNIMMENVAGSGGAIHTASAVTPIADHNGYHQNSPEDFSSGTGNVSANPGFLTMVAGGFTITIDSPIADVPIPDMPLFEDYEGDIRPSNQGFDLGADEVGGCFATILGKENVVFGSVQLAAETAVANDTVLVDGICQNANSQLLGTDTISQTLLITKNLTIDGSWNHPDDTSGITTTLQANDQGRVVYIDAGSAVTITNIQLSAGNAITAGGTSKDGGGIYNAGELILVNAWIQGNNAEQGGGIYNEGTLTLSETPIFSNTATQDGGGLYNNAPGNTTTIVNNKFAGNKAGESGNGGGIYQQAGTLEIEKSRFSSNIAGGNGAALYLNSGSDSVNITNNIIDNNDAYEGGGIYNVNTDANIWHNTLYKNTAQNRNGGGIANNNGDPDIRNNIIDRSEGSGLYSLNSITTADYNNVIGNTWGNYDPFTLEGANDISQQPNYVDPFVGDFHLLQGSAGEDVGDIDVPVSDDIDEDMRPTNGGPDMGADEINSCLVRVNDEIFGVLQDAIDYADTHGYTTVEIARGECRGVKYNDDSKTYQVGYVPSSLRFTGSLRRLDFADMGDYYNLAIGGLTTMINGADEGHAIYVAPGAEPIFEQIAFVGGNAIVGQGNDGGALHKEGTGHVEVLVGYFCDSTAVNGGGIYIDPSATFDISGVRIGYCYVRQVTEDQSGVVTEVRSKYFPSNYATQNGGGFYIGGEMSLRNASVFRNSAGVDGGGGYFESSSTGELINVTFFSSTAFSGVGGGLYNAGSGVNVYHNTIRDNVADDGGGIYNIGNNFQLNSSIVYTNSARNVTGIGGLYSSAAINNLTYNNFYANSPSDHPGLTNNNPIIGEPGLWGIRLLNVDSVNIDRADPSLLELEPDPIDYDFNKHYSRPDGNIFLPYQPPHGLYSDVGAYEYYKDFGCAIQGPSGTNRVAPGDSITYTLTIINTGNPSYLSATPWFSNGYTDTITVTLNSQTQGWSLFEGGEEQTVLLGWDDETLGEATTRVLTVTVPLDALESMSEVTTIGCQSKSLPIRTNSINVTTNVGEKGGVLVEPNYYDEAIPGEVRVYTQTITNQQNKEATYLLTASSGLQHANAVLLDADTMLPVSNITVTLSPTGTENVSTTAYLQVTFLETAVAGEYATPGLVATDISSKKLNSSNNVTLILNAPGTRHVAGDSGADNTNCSNPIQPCATIQYAIEQAVDGDDIKVAAFTYTDFTTRTVGADTLYQNVFLNKAVSISGGYTTTEQVPFTTRAPITNSVILDGQGSRRVIYVADGITTTISGLFIQNGMAATGNTIVNGSTRDFGGGIYNVGGNLNITATWVLSSSAKYGGGLYQAQGNLFLNNSVFVDNVNETPTGASEAAGAGVFISDTVAIIENNTFVNNLAETGNDGGEVGEGNAIYQNEGEMTLVNNIFQGNDIGNGTYAVYIAGSSPLITNDFNLYDGQVNNINVTPGSSSNTGNPEFVDAYYHIGPNSAALDQGTTDTTYVRPELLAGGDYELEARVQGSSIDIGADEKTQEPKFVFVPPIRSASIEPGATVTYTHWLTNTGDFNDDYTLTMNHQVTPVGDPTWMYTLVPTQTGTLVPFEGIKVTLVVTGGQAGYVDTTTIIALADSGLSASVQDTTTVSQTANVEIAKSETDSGLPGELITYTHTLTNTGTGMDEFTLTATAVPTDWVYSLLPSQPFYVAADASVPFTVTVLIPDNVNSGDQHQIVVTATAENPYAFDTLTDTTTVAQVTGLTLEPDNERPVADGSSTIYTHTLTSGSNVVDTVTLTATGSLPNWDVSIEPKNITLFPFQSEIVSVTVNVPVNTGGLMYVTQVTATSSLPNLVATATNTTTVPLETGITFTPNLTKAVSPGETAHYTHTLMNSGNYTDTFALSSNSSNNWLLDGTTGSLVVGPGASVQVTAVISVPLSAAYPDEDTLEITAVSLADTDTSATVTDITQVLPYVEVMLTPDREDTADAGTTKVYTHTLTNNGDIADSIDLTYSGVPAWGITFEPASSVTVPSGEAVVITANLTIPSGASGVKNITHITATSTIDTRISDTVVNTTTVTGIPQVLNVSIEPDRTDSGLAGETIIYHHIVTNTGTGIDDIILSVDALWLAMVDPLSITGMVSGASAPVTVTVMIPADATAGEVDLAIVTAASGTDLTIADTVVNTTTVTGTSPVFDVTIEPDRSDSGDPGETITYYHTVTNNGTETDSIDLSVDSVWSASVEPMTINNLVADASVPVTVTVMIPVSAGPGEMNETRVTAVSDGDPTVSSNVTDTTTVNEPPDTGVVIEPDQTKYGVGEQTIAYIHTVTNTGDAEATFSVDFTSTRDWVQVVSPTSLTLDVNETAQVTVILLIPTGSRVGVQDITTVTVTSTTDGSVTDSAVDTTIVPGVFLPIVLKPEEIAPPPTHTPTPTPTQTPTATSTPTATPQSCSETGIDLIVTEIRVDPAIPTANVPATVYVTIKNAGSVDVSYGNNFFLDFYVDQQPALNMPGHYEWGVQGVLMKAGRSKTFETSYSFGNSSHQLWAQVDTTNVVDECPYENNNIRGPQPLNVSGGSQAGAEEMPITTPIWDGEIRSTPTPDPRLNPIISESIAPVSTPTATPTPTHTPFPGG